jgi:hypothetical protein
MRNVAPRDSVLSAPTSGRGRGQYLYNDAL